MLTTACVEERRMDPQKGLLREVLEVAFKSCPLDHGVEFNIAARWAPPCEFIVDVQRRLCRPGNLKPVLAPFTSFCARREKGQLGPTDDPACVHPDALPALRLLESRLVRHSLVYVSGVKQ